MCDYREDIKIPLWARVGIWAAICLLVVLSFCAAILVTTATYKHVTETVKQVQR